VDCLSVRPSARPSHTGIVLKRLSVSLRGYSIYESGFGYLVRMRLSCNFVNVYTIAYRVHVYTRASLIHSRHPNPDSSNRVSLKLGLCHFHKIITERSSFSYTIVGDKSNRVYRKVAF